MTGKRKTTNSKASQSPGMEGRYTDSYNVMLFRSDGTTEVYAHY